MKKSSNNSKNVQDLLLQMFTFIPQGRISIKDIRKHEWYKSIKGYNESEESQRFFQSTMRKIHNQLQSKQMEQSKSTTNYISSAMMLNRVNNTQTKATTFDMEKLRYDMC